MQNDNTPGRDSQAKENEQRHKVFIAPATIGIFVILATVGAILLFKPARAAPEVTFTALSGQKQSTADLRGKVVLVNFWATSCTTCVAEMPQLIETYNTYHDQGFETIAVAMFYDRPDYVANFTETRKLPFTVALDLQGTLAKSFGNVKLTPTTFLIDKQGRMIRHYVGPPDFEKLHALLEQELKR